MLYIERRQADIDLIVALAAKISNQWNYGSSALLGWKRSNVLFSHCTYTDVAFIRFGLDCKQIIRFGLDCKQKSADAFKLRGC